MHGDITRSTFDPAKAYSSVRQQQGRVQIDADANEQRDIELHDERRWRADVIGASGAPIGDPGMQITSTGTGLGAGAGRYYVEGIRVENPEPFPLVGLPRADGFYLICLDVWERCITAVEDPTIREVALGGPDTSTRTKVTWRVWALPVTTTGTAPGCDSAFPEWAALTEGSTGTLAVRAEATGAVTDPCLVPETAGYRGLDNRTYRVQIHDGNFDPTRPDTTNAVTPTFKWSRDNGSILATWAADPAGTVDVTVDRMGPGGTDGFTRGGWVELTSDKDDLHERPGVLAQVDDLAGSVLTLADPGDLATDLEKAYDDQAHPKVRAWDSPGAPGLSAGTWIELERGLQVRFSSRGSWRSGDAWVIPARTAILPGSRNRQIDWPVDEAGNPLRLRAQGPRHHYARLALARLSGKAWTVVGDCRERFAPLVDDVQFSARGGEGQHAPSGHWLAAPLVAGVSRGTYPSTGAKVRFRVAGGGGRLSATEPGEDGGVAAETGEVVATTGPEGLARVWFRLGPAAPYEEPGDTYQALAAQQVVAELLDDDGDREHLPLWFTATAVDPLLLVDAGGNGQLGRPGATLELALRARVSAGMRPGAGQRVAFEIQSRMLAGSALDEFRGGSLHASVNVLGTESWPAGTRTVRAVVATDELGVAQVQWILGTELGLPVQRVTATLLDPAGNPTSQRLLYGAHLAVAGELDWDPGKVLAGALTGATVQEALDLFGQMLGALNSRGIVVLNAGEKPLVPDTVVKVVQWTGLELRTRLVLKADPSVKALTSALVVAAELPTVVAGTIVGHTTVRMMGNPTVQRDEAGSVFRWTATDPAALLHDPTADGSILVRVNLLPGLLPVDPPSGVPWYGAFRVSA